MLNFRTSVRFLKIKYFLNRAKCFDFETNFHKKITRIIPNLTKDLESNALGNVYIKYLVKNIKQFKECGYQVIRVQLRIGEPYAINKMVTK